MDLCAGVPFSIDEVTLSDQPTAVINIHPTQTTLPHRRLLFCPKSPYPCRTLFARLQLHYSTKSETALEAERAVDRVPAAAEWVSAVAAFAASVWHGPGSLLRKRQSAFLSLQSERGGQMLHVVE
jgi:hypothetical protein